MAFFEISMAVQVRSLPMLAALLSFGGVCVIFQIALLYGDVSVLKLMLYRAFGGAASFVFCRFFMKLDFFGYELDTYSREFVVFSSSSILPSIILLIMTGLLLTQKVWTNEN